MKVAIGNGIYAEVRAPKMSLLEEYRAKQAKCEHPKRDPRGMCYSCGNVVKEVAK